MLYKFEPVTRVEYQIIRDYYVSNDHLQGIYFLMYDEKNNELITRFLKKELIQNQFLWNKKGMFDKTHYAIGVEKGERNIVVFEKGTLTIIKANYSNETTHKKVNAEKTTFLLKALDHYNPVIKNK